ncbi:hypothetical protein OK016_06280 [Vibrio chagasii]|nr:hypothetical protein [Vibrio chagasii]
MAKAVSTRLMVSLKPTKRFGYIAIELNFLHFVCSNIKKSSQPS